MLFNAIVVHGSLPDTFMYSTIVPIPKTRNVNISNSSNYRGIALSSLYGKLFDNVVLMYFSDKLTTSELQFGFKANSSMSQCTFVLKESLAYYVNNKSSVYCAFWMLRRHPIESTIVSFSDYSSGAIYLRYLSCKGKLCHTGYRRGAHLPF